MNAEILVEKAKITQVVLDTELTVTENLIKLVTMVRVYNSRVKESGALAMGKEWSNDRLLLYLRDVVLVKEPSFTSLFLARSRQKSRVQQVHLRTHRSSENCFQK